VSVPPAFSSLLMLYRVCNATHPASPAQPPDLPHALPASLQPLLSIQALVSAPQPSSCPQTVVNAADVTAPALVAQAVELDSAKAVIREGCSVLAGDQAAVAALWGSSTLHQQAASPVTPLAKPVPAPLPLTAPVATPGPCPNLTNVNAAPASFSLFPSIATPVQPTA
jgi:hypothetical protein